jgi:uroporphyrinogen decarboxylase
MLQTIDLRGMENWFLDHVEAPDKLAYVLDRIVEIRACQIARYAAAGVDGVITWDDMGTNEQPFVSPAMFRELYFPRYKRATDQMHEHGMHFIHHCCGQVRSYMDMFVEAGCDVLQLDQPALMGIDWLGDNYGGRMCFWNSSDIQTTLASGSLEAIEAEARQQIWKLGNYGGGFMVKAYQQPESIGTTVERAQCQYDSFKRHGNYPLVRP